ncbi:MAG: tyrosine--tRNA ligase, partial [Candidatus Nanohaloarchaea archaeon]|nr:tyrosine--tRNA ligase [Candidatus Nanohaloarchaea archaeon]
SGLSGGKMSASVEKSKIGIHDSREEVREKMMDAYCPAGEAEGNGVLEYIRYLVFPILTEEDRKFVIEREEQYGGDVSYGEYMDLEEDYVSGEIHPEDLKSAAAEHVAELLQPVQERFEGEEELLRTAYPGEYGG